MKDVGLLQMNVESGSAYWFCLNIDLSVTILDKVGQNTALQDLGADVHIILLKVICKLFYLSLIPLPL